MPKTPTVSPRPKKQSAPKPATKPKRRPSWWLWLGKTPAMQWYKARRRVWQILIALPVIALVVVCTSSLIDRSLQPAPTSDFGVSFSKPYAQHLGVDWKANFTALLDDLGIRKYRLMSYWEDHEPSPGKYTFESLDWQMDEVAKRGGKVSLAIGMRQPRWPECHQPEWAKKITDYDQWKAAINSYLTVVVNRYKHHPALLEYQLENEALNNTYGPCKDFNRTRLAEEFKLVKSLDPNHPIAMTLSDQHGYPVREPKPDIFGFSIYRKVHNDKLIGFYFVYPTPVWYHRLRASLVESYAKKPIFVHELQLEPWGPDEVGKLTTEQQNESMSLRQMEDNLLFARKTHLSPIYMWGGEWWYWRKTVKNDPARWDFIKRELTKHQRP